MHGLHAQHAAVLGKAVRQFGAADHICQAAPHEALDRGNGVLWVLRHGLQGVKADLAAAALKVANHRGQYHPALPVWQALGHAVAHRCHQRMGGAQVYAHGQPALVRVGRLPGF